MTDKYAQIYDGIVLAVVQPVPGFTLEQCFPEDVVSACMACGEDVEQGWHVQDGVFSPPPSEQPNPKNDVQMQAAKIDARLAAIDQESIRPLRAIAKGTATEEDKKKLADLEAEADTLRRERAEVTE